MSIKGRPITWMEASIRRGDFAGAWSEAHSMSRVPLDHALALTVLASDQDDPNRSDRAAARWLARLSAEEPSVELAPVAAALAGLPDLLAVSQLTVICQEHGWQLAAAALDRLLPA